MYNIITGYMLPILNQSLWRDEAFSVLLSQKTPFEIIKLTTKDMTPPFHYLLLHYWMLILGNSEIIIRSLSFIFHISTTLLIFLIARKLFKSTIAQLLLSLTALLNPFLLQYAFEARPYSLLAFLTILAIYFIMSKKNLMAGIALALGILTHNFGVFNFIAFAFWFIYTQKDNFKIKKTIVFLSFPLLSVILWGNVIWNQWEKVASGFWIKQTTSSIFLHSFEMYTKGDLSYPTQSMLYFFSLIITFFAFSYWVFRQKDQETKIPLLFLSVFSIPILITYFISTLFTPIYHERYLIAAAPILILIIGYSLNKLYYINPNIRNVLIGSIAIYFILLIQSSEQIIATSTKTPINWAVSQILSKAQKGDIIIPQDQLNFLETKYYVQKSGSNMSVFAYNPSGKIPFYIGAVLYDPKEIITQMPKDKRVWQLKPDGGYTLLNL